MCFEVVCFYLKDFEGLEVDIVEENDYIGIVFFFDFKILFNFKYFKVFVNKVFFKKYIWNFSL